MATAALPVMSFATAASFAIKPKSAMISSSGAAASKHRGLISIRPTISSSTHAFLPLPATTSPSPVSPVVSEITYEEETEDVTEFVALYESDSISEEIISVYESGSEEVSETESLYDDEGSNSSKLTTYQSNPMVEKGKPKFADVKMGDGAAAARIKVPGVAKNVHYGNNIYILVIHPFVKFGNRSCFDVELDKDAARVRVDIPGVKAEGLKLWFEGDVLKIEGLESKKYGAVGKQEAPARVYRLSVKIPEGKLLKKEETMAKLEDGVLNVVIPMIKFEDRDDIIHVNVA